MTLNNQKFLDIIEATPLVAIDLIVRNERGDVLLGKRKNRPAQNYWFVPGGRIRKNEKSQDALQRIAQAELGLTVQSGTLLGVFDHFYEDNFFGEDGISTHYVTLAYQLAVSNSERLTHDAQHAEIKWWNIESMQASPAVHENTKLYFSGIRTNGFWCECA